MHLSLIHFLMFKIILEFRLTHSTTDLPSLSSNVFEEKLATNLSQSDKKECKIGSCNKIICVESEISLEKHSARYNWKVNGLQNFISSMKSHGMDLNMTTSTKFNSLPSHDGDWILGLVIKSGGELKIQLLYSLNPVPFDQNIMEKFTYNVNVTVLSSGIKKITFPPQTTQISRNNLSSLPMVWTWTDRVDKIILQPISPGRIDTIVLQFMINAFRINPIITSNVDCKNIQMVNDLDEHGSNLPQKLEPLPHIGNLMSDDRYTDLVIKSGDEEFKVHRAILANSSPIFAQLIFNQTFEKNESLLDLGEKIGSDTVEEIIRYIYTGKIEEIDEIADSLIIAAYKYGYPQLKSLCESALLNQVRTENAFVMYSLSTEVGADRLRQKSFKIMKENKSKIVNQTEEFRKLSVHHPEIMYELCLSN